ncbi:MAG: ubiquitin-like domain-containing protein [Candidatus Hodarchaeota archaeon]
MSENDDIEDFDLEIEEEKEVVESKKPVKSKIPKGSQVKLVFRSTIGPGEKLEELTVDADLAVAELKATLGNIIGLDPDGFHLSIGGRTLDTDDILSNYEIEDGQEVLIIPVSTAGMT